MDIQQTNEDLLYESRLALREILEIIPDFKWKSEDDIWEMYWELTIEEEKLTG